VHPPRATPSNNHFESMCNIYIYIYIYKPCVSHKPPPLCVVIWVRAYGSHSLLNAPQPFGIALVPPIVISTHKFYSMARGTSIKKCFFLIGPPFLHTYSLNSHTHTLKHPNPKTMSNTSCGLITTILLASYLINPLLLH
jgi:hypothetical protein